MDQGISKVTEQRKDGATTGYNIQVDNLDRLPMPIILAVKTKSGKTEVIKIPVDVWMRNTSWTVYYPTTEEVVSVTLDPDKVLPDVNPDNNSWNK